MQVNVTGFQIKELFEKSKKPLVILGEGSDTDLSSLAAALVEIFESYNKKTFFVGKSPLPEAAKPLVKPEQQREHLDPKSLVISLDWIDNQLSKVSYEVEGKEFNLIITSQGKKIDPTEIKFAYRGQDWDLIVTVGVRKLEDLYKLGIDEDSFSRIPSINFDKNSLNSSFAKLNVVNSDIDSVCSRAAQVFKEAALTLPTRAAETLLYGMRTVTNNFTNVTEPATFEAAAFCKRSMIPGMINSESQPASGEKETKGEQPAEWVSPKVFRSGRIS